ncbi:hypothetical protein IQ13_4248 [Lacibacter cauensis]|uniref:Uncharacterized protein n=1 Tax=Lacibacter cauensis TaxID=510947 RepID=A0A562SAX5_9BACT|nr:hypothetical protein [Lacibacter cauensis]TWI78004.1 hypothetical protein IQ13_4248 [Lacibacter cauensis]
MMKTSLFTRLFCFKKPRVIQLSYLPMLVKNKPFLFVAWELKHAYTVKFIPLRNRYHAAHNAAVVTIPAHFSQITFKAANYWRKTTIILQLQMVQLDEAATAQLIDGFQPLNKTVLHTPQIAHLRNNISCKRLKTQQRFCTIKQINQFKVTTQPLATIIQPILYQ